MAARIPRSDSGAIGRTELLGAGAATAWLAAVVIVDLVTPDVVFVAFFSVCPLIAAATLSGRATAFFGAVAIGLAALAGVWDHVSGTAQQWVRFADVCVISVVAVAVAAVRVRREQRFSRVVAIADAAQRAVLPMLPRHLPGVLIAARYESAAEDALVGGDLYDAIHVDGTVRIVIGDVRGKGLAAVQHAARVIRSFRQFGAAATDLASVAKQMNDYLLPFFDDEDFVTALLIECSETDELTLANCGHHPPLLAHGDHVGEIRGLEGTLPLGMATDFPTVTATWSPGDRLLLYTDGLLEARNGRGDFLPEAAVRACLAADDVDEILDSLLARLVAHTGGRMTDDLAVVVVRHEGHT